jgi:molecular chaperone GrpE
VNEPHDADSERDPDGQPDGPDDRRDAGDGQPGPDADPEASGSDEGREEPGRPEAGDGASERQREEGREEPEEMEELREKHLRLAAEFENYRKRTRREMSEARQRGQAELAERLLEALDDLERVLETPEDSTTVEALREGVEMVQRKLEKELSEAGLVRLEPEGEAFDPEYHEALLTVPTEEPDENDVVSRVLINGYVFGDRVLRPARVEVKKYSAGDDGEAGGER